MNSVLRELPDGRATSTATIGRWNAPASTFTWVTAGDQPPLRITDDGQLIPLEGTLYPELGDADFPQAVTASTCRLDSRERLLLLSDSFIDPTHGLGLPTIARAVAKAGGEAAAATLRAIEDALRETQQGDLSDDATVVVLAPSGMAGQTD